MDIYFDDEQVEKAILDITNDVVFQNLPVAQATEPPPVPTTNTAAPPSNPFELRRYI